MPSSASQMRSKSLSLSKLSSKGNNNGCMMNTSVLLFIAVVGIVLNLIFVISLDNLEKNSKCDCSKIPERDFLKEWFSFMIVVIVIEVLAFSISNEECWEHFTNYPAIYITMLIISLFNIIMLIRLFIYVRILKNKCECAYGGMENFIYWYLIIVFSIFAAYIILTIFILFITFLKFFSS